MQIRALCPILALSLGACVVVGGDEAGADEAETGETGGGDGVGEVCPEPTTATRTFEVELFGFPEAAEGVLVGGDGNGLDFTGSCVVDSLEFADGELSVGLSCEHPEPSLPEGAGAVITTAASGVPAGLELGETLTLEALAFESQGGDLVEPELAAPVLSEQFRLLSGATTQSYALYDELGLVFVGTAGVDAGVFDAVTVERDHNCPGFELCGSEGTISGYITASSEGAAINVLVGEVAVLDTGDQAWDVSLFHMTLDGFDCHGIGLGSFSVVRRP